MGKIVGRIVEVKGLAAKAKLFNLLPPYLIKSGKRELAPNINGFVKTRVGLDIIICQVKGESSQEIDGAVTSHYLDLQVKGYIDNQKFIQGLRMLPIVSANIETLDETDLSFIYTGGDENKLEVGNDLFDDSKTICVAIDKIIPSHIGVFGNTGSGKSNTLAKILFEYGKTLEKVNNGRSKFLVFDINNEYSENAIAENALKKIYRLSTSKKGSDQKIPLNIQALSEDDFVVLMNASEKTQVPVVKNAYKQIIISDSERHEKKYYLNYVFSIINNARKILFFSLRHYLSSYIKNLDAFQFHSVQGKFFVNEFGTKIFSDMSGFDRFLDAIDIEIPAEPLDRFLFELYFSVAQENENGVNLDFMMPLISRARKLIGDLNKVFDFKKEFSEIFEEKNICVVQLGDVNKDMREIVPSIVTNNIFERLAEEKEEKGVQQIINVIVDEAHNILYEENRETSAHKNVLEVFEKAVKEGRKFGLFLMVSSQRPSDISETIISQFHNYFIHKLVNPSDIQRIRKAVAYMDESSLDFITVLAPGECIVSGTAFQMPTFLHVSQVPEKYRPTSGNVNLTGPKGLLSKKKSKISL